MTHTRLDQHESVPARDAAHDIGQVLAAAPAAPSRRPRGMRITTLAALTAVGLMLPGCARIVSGAADLAADGVGTLVGETIGLVPSLTGYAAAAALDRTGEAAARTATAVGDAAGNVAAATTAIPFKVTRRVVETAGEGAADNAQAAAEAAKGIPLRLLNVATLTPAQMGEIVLKNGIQAAQIVNVRDATKAAVSFVRGSNPNTFSPLCATGKVGKPFNIAGKQLPQIVAEGADNC